MAELGAAGRGWNMAHTAKEWNPRYVAYAKAHDMTPEAMLAYDDVMWPGGLMCGFLVWMGEQWAAFARVPEHREYRIGAGWKVEGHAAFDLFINVPDAINWLQAFYDKRAAILA